MKPPWHQMFTGLGLRGFWSMSNPENPHHVAFLRSLKVNKYSEQPLSTRLDQLKVVVFDLETTGFRATQGDEILSIGAVKFDGFGEEGQEYFYTLINPQREIPDHISELTGIDQLSVTGAPSLLEAIGKFMGFVENRILITHFSRHDKFFLEAALWKTCRTKLFHRVMDTVVFISVSLSGMERLFDGNDSPSV